MAWPRCSIESRGVDGDDSHGNSWDVRALALQRQCWHLVISCEIAHQPQPPVNRSADDSRSFNPSPCRPENTRLPIIRSFSDRTVISLDVMDIYANWLQASSTSFGDRAFCAAGSRLWNYLPTDPRHPNTAVLGSRQRRSHLDSGTKAQFDPSFNCASEILLLIYLLC